MFLFYFEFTLSLSILEWTGTLIKFLKDQVPKLQEHYAHTEKSNPPVPTAAADAEQKLAIRQWSYCAQLLKYMYEEGNYYYLRLIISFNFLFSIY